MGPGRLERVEMIFTQARLRGFGVTTPKTPPSFSRLSILIGLVQKHSPNELKKIRSILSM